MDTKSRVSIKDIARQVGVSHSTVSRALRDNPQVAPETRAHIRAIAQQLGYSPNIMARSLVTQQSRALGVVVTTIADPFVAEVVRGIEETAVDRGYRVLLSTSQGEPEREVNVVQALHEWRVDGVIVTASRVGSLYSQLLNQIGVPIVLINNQQEGKYLYSVATNNVQAARLATEHLLDLGHRRIGYIAVASHAHSNEDRLTGYRRALAKRNIAFDPALVANSNDRADGAEQAVLTLLENPEPPTAIFCYNDITAIGALQALKHARRRVPEDISLVGFDDIYFAAYTDPPLTTIHQQKAEMGSLAVKMLISLLKGEKDIKDRSLRGTLVVRASTAPRAKKVRMKT
jgi:DNA-binding LacI/PurR family transcriptional regulator